MSSLIDTTTTTNGTKGFVPKDFFINCEVIFTNTAGEAEVIRPKTGIGLNWSELSPELAETLKTKSLGINGTATEALANCFTVEITRIVLAQKTNKKVDKVKQKLLAANTPD